MDWYLSNQWDYQLDVVHDDAGFDRWMIMLSSILFHMGLEMSGAGILMCIKGTCRHDHPILGKIRKPLIALGWIGMSVLTVWIVG